MKRPFVIIIPILLLVLLNACGNTTAQITTAEGTAVGQTQTAAMWTVTISPTIDPNESKMVEWLNDDLSKVDPLERTLDANYRVVGLTFPAQNGIAAVFRLDVRCECATYNQCCNPERMFVVILNLMRERGDKITDQVPATVSWMNLVCYDRLNQIAVVSAPWQYVRSYLLQQITGYELGPWVSRGSRP